ncbi:MAG: hypothetical protein J6A79_07465 [Clostridia bacterium]|nr:hypothetical protein [Clostridia bacterium]
MENQANNKKSAYGVCPPQADFSFGCALTIEYLPPVSDRLFKTKTYWYMLYYNTA